VPSEPSYHYDEAKKEMAADDKVKLLRAEVRQRRGDQQELRKLLKACTDAAPTK